MHRQTCLDLGRERKKLIDELTTVVIPICRITPLRSVPVQNQLALGSNTQTGVLNGFDATALIVSQLADAVTDAIVENSVCLKTRDSEVQSPDARCEKVSNVFGNHYNGTDWSKVEYSICGITTLTCNRVKDCEDWGVLHCFIVCLFVFVCVCCLCMCHSVCVCVCVCVCVSISFVL